MAFKVGISDALFDSQGNTLFDPECLGAFERASVDIEWQRLPPSATIPPSFTDTFDALYVFLEPVTEASFSTMKPRTRIIARHGVGFDSVDLDVASARNILVTNTPFAVRKPVATMAITFVLALAQKLMIKEALTRQGGWAESLAHVGMGLTERTIGIVGAGGIGREIARRIAPFDMHILASDPYADAASLKTEGIELVSLDRLLREADFVVLTCTLTPDTRHLMSGPQFTMMKPTAYIINVARGPVIDEAALIFALQSGQIAGAGLDVFEQEPVSRDNPLLKMANTIVTPHSLSLTDESFSEIARTAIVSIVDVASSREPRHVVNKRLLETRDEVLQSG